MMFLALWAIAVALLACWSGFIWAAHALLTALLAHAGQLGAGDWRLPEPLAAWLPTGVAEWLTGTLETWAPQLQSLLGWVPALSGGVTLLGWLAWGMGALLLLAVALACHVAVALWRKSSRSTAPASVTPVR